MKKKRVKQQTTYTLVDWSERLCLKNQTKDEIETYFLDDLEGEKDRDVLVFDQKGNEYEVETETITRLIKIPKTALLASEIYEKNFEALHKKEKQEFKKILDAVTLTKAEEKICEILKESSIEYNKLRRSYGYGYGSSFTNAKEVLLDSKRSNLKESKSKYPTQSQLEKDITLAMLDAKSVDELVNKIKQKYKI